MSKQDQLSMDEEALFRDIHHHILRQAKPAAAKGQYIKSCVAAATMGPGVKMNANKQI